MAVPGVNLRPAPPDEKRRHCLWLPPKRNRAARMKKDHYFETLNKEEVMVATFAALTPMVISIDILIMVSALSAIKILTLLERFIAIGLLEKHPGYPMGIYRFTDFEAADALLDKLEAEQVAAAAKRIISLIENKVEESIDKDRALAHLYLLSKPAGMRMERVLRAANHLQTIKKRKQAALYYQLILDNPPPPPLKEKDKLIYIEAALGLVDVQGSHVPLPLQGVYLKKARKLAKQIDTPELLTRINLIYARVLTRNSGEMTRMAQQLIKEACQVARHSGEKNLVRKTEIAQCVFLLWGGRIAEAIRKWDMTVGHLDDLSFLDEDDLHYYAALGWAYGTCGYTARGIGLCEAALEKARRIKNDELRCYINMMAGMVLFEARRFDEGAAYFERILTYPEDAPGGFPLRQAHHAMALIAYRAGRLPEAFEHLKKGFDYSQRFGWFHHRAPWIFDCLEALEKHGYVVPEHSFAEELKHILTWPDKYMNGIAYQLRAQYRLKNGDNTAAVYKDLAHSRQLLQESGGRIELGRTLTFLAQFYVRDGRTAQAVQAAREAREILVTVNEELFPKELEHLIAKENPEELLLGTMIKVGNTLGTIRNRKELLEKIILLSVHLTLAERGGVFLVNRDDAGLELAASRNLDPEVVTGEPFANSYAIIAQVAASGRGTIIDARQTKQRRLSEAPGLSWIICCPILLQSRVLGVFYLDSGHEPRGVQDKDLALIEAIGTQVAIALDNVEAYEQIALLRDRLESESRFFQMEVAQSRHFDQIIGGSDAMRLIQAQMQKVAPTDTAVLIQGETGVGKELVARGIHRLSKRAGGPFIPVNTAALSEGLVASELFGHERGAFTGAVQSHPGRFGLADGGTIFLDDIQNISLEIQAKLLRAIQEKKFERVGGTKTVESDFRIIAASNQPLKEMVERGEFRSDLYYRLNVFPIHIPPLRERPEDIPLLALHFLELFKRKLGKNIRGISQKDMEWLIDYSWPGNVRELEHIIERAVILTDGEMLYLPESKKKKLPLGPLQTARETLKEHERLFIVKTLRECGWRVSGPYGAAKVLDVKTTTLFAKMKRLGIERGKAD